MKKAIQTGLVESFLPLLKQLDRSKLGERIAYLSEQIKVEQLLLAEMALVARHCRGVSRVALEAPPRRDLMIYGEGSDEWVEAKMAYSDCVARGLRNTKRKNTTEYEEAVQRDMKRMDVEAAANTFKTAVLFVVHQHEPTEHHKYYPSGNGRTHCEKVISAEAARYCREEVPGADYKLFESVKITLQAGTELLAFFYRPAQKA